MDFAPVFRGDGIEQMRSGHAARRIQIPAAALDQVIVEQAENLVRRDPAPLLIDDAEAICVPVGGEPDLRFARHNDFR